MSERKPTHPKKTTIKKPDINRLAEIFDNDVDLALFYSEWLDNGKNALEAYHKLHPEVTRNSAGVLGHRILKKVNPALIMREFGIDENLYFKQLYEGVQATKRNDFTGEREADHKTRLPYHDKVGKMLGVEKETASGNVQIVNVLNKLDEQKKAYNLDE